eukprot:gene7497-11820_t
MSSVNSNELFFYSLVGAVHAIKAYQYFTQPKEEIRQIVLCGPSGVGKGTIIKKLQDKYQGKFTLSVSYTTRKPRPGEEDGVHYNFTTHEVMEEEIKKGNFIEHAHVHGNYYGSSKKAVTDAKGKCCIFDIDIQGAKQVREYVGLEPVFIFLYADIEEIEKRLRGRGTEKEEDIQKRLKNGRKELEIGLAKDGLFDYTVKSDTVERTLEELEQIIEKHIMKLN